VNLGGYGAIRRLRVPVWVAVVLGLIWGIKAGLDLYHAPEVEAAGAENIYLLYADREMRMLDGASHESGFVRWLFDAEEEERKKVVRQFARSFDAAADDGILREDGAVVRATLHWEPGEEVRAREALGEGTDNADVARFVMRQVPAEATGEPDQEDLAALTERVASGSTYAWEAWILRLADAGESDPDSDVWIAYNGYCRTLTQRVFLVMVTTLVIAITGLVCLPFMVARWFSQPAPRFHRIVQLWSVPLVFALCFGAGLIGDYSIAGIGGGFELFEVWPTILWVAYDTTWRLLPVVALAI
jgi:hypothetical protein